MSFPSAPGAKLQDVTVLHLHRDQRFFLFHASCFSEIAFNDLGFWRVNSDMFRSSLWSSSEAFFETHIWRQQAALGNWWPYWRQFGTWPKASKHQALQMALVSHCTAIWNICNICNARRHARKSSLRNLTQRERVLKAMKRRINDHAQMFFLVFPRCLL